LQLYNSGIAHYDFAKRWQKPGDENSTIIPSMVYPLSNSNRDDFYAATSVNVFKGDNIRFEYVRVSYNLDKRLLKKTLFQNLQLYSTISNLGILWRANKGKLDPDYDIGNSWLPVPKQWAIGVKADF
jgi:hypothetical protein